MQQEVTSILVRNLDEKVTEEVLYELFLQAGPLEDVRISTVNSVSRNCGYVTFTHEESIPYAINLLDGTILYGRSIFLKDARLQQNFSPREHPLTCFSERLGHRPVDDGLSLRAAPGSTGRRYNDISMQPTRHSNNKERYADDSRRHRDWALPRGSLDLYPSQKHSQMTNYYSCGTPEGHLIPRHRGDYGGFSHSRKPYETSSRHRDFNRYDYKNYRRSN